MPKDQALLVCALVAGKGQIAVSLSESMRDKADTLELICRGICQVAEVDLPALAEAGLV